MRGRSGLGPEPGQRRLEPFVREGSVEEGVARLQELACQLWSVVAGDAAQAPELLAEVAHGRRVLECLEDACVPRTPVLGEGGTGLRIVVAAHAGKAVARAAEARGGGDRLLQTIVVVVRGEGPRVAVEVAQSALVELEVLDDAGVPGHDVRARAAIDLVARESLDG